jgi:hypothetical protein
VTVAALVLLAALALVALPLWGEYPPLPRVSLPPAIVAGVAATVLAVAGALAWRAGPAGPGASMLAAGLAVACSVTTGGPVVVAVLHLADQTQPPGTPSPADPRLLGGGAWIGGLERVAVTAALLAGWPEATAVVLAVKGLGRYPELRAPAAAERFIIGTLASVLWAAGCAGVAIAVRR